MSRYELQWWQRGVVYQIYPRSFQDASGDGVGDLRGILSRLGYLGWLGVDAIWISPFYPSPMADFGYDVSDHTDVHPMFGTLSDFDELVEEAHSRHLKVILDYVPNHTSDEHPWFVESRSSRESPKRDWYLWGIRPAPHSEPRGDGAGEGSGHAPAHAARPPSTTATRSGCTTSRYRPNASRTPSRRSSQDEAWDAGPNAGFCQQDAEPWLPVAAEREDRRSMLALHRRLLAPRRAESSLTVGSYEPLETAGDVLAYAREKSRQRVSSNCAAARV